MKTSIWPTIVILAVGFIVAWFYNFQPDYEYSWYWMFFHGALIIPNWVYSWFIDTKMCKPILYTGAYNFWWWVSVIGICISVFVNAISFVITFVSSYKQARQQGGFE